MCEFAGKLVAWLDRELPEADAVNVEQHLRQCAECRRAISFYQEISGALLEACWTTLPPKPVAHRRRWIAISGAVAAAAAIVLAAVLSYPRAQQLQAAPSPVHPPGIAFEKTPPIVAAQVLRPRPRSPIRESWAAAGPTVEVALPADALFPPGAVPAGFSFIADIRPQP